MKKAYFLRSFAVLSLSILLQSANAFVKLPGMEDVPITNVYICSTEQDGRVAIRIEPSGEAATSKLYLLNVDGTEGMPVEITNLVQVPGAHQATFQVEFMGSVIDATLSKIKDRIELHLKKQVAPGNEEETLTYDCSYRK